MTSVTLPRRIAHLHSVVSEHRHPRTLSSDDEDTNEILTKQRPLSSIRKSTKATGPGSGQLAMISPSDSSSATASVTSSSSSNPNRFKHLCLRLKRRLTIHREHRAQTQELRDSLTDRRRSRLGRYISFSSTVTDDEPPMDFQWPDFEKLYDSIPACLLNALPGIDDFHTDDVDDRDDHDRSSSFIDDEEEEEESEDEDDDVADEDIHHFFDCKRGPQFRRNAVCQKVDKVQYHGQLDTFIQQLMIEKLMRTWS